MKRIHVFELGEVRASNNLERPAAKQGDERVSADDYWEGKIITPELKLVFETISSESGVPFEEIVEAFRKQKCGFVCGLCTMRQRLLALGERFIGENAYEILSPLIQELNRKLG